MQIINNRIITDVSKTKIQSNQAQFVPNHSKSFQDVFNETVEATSKLQFSKHANMRLNARDISLSQDQLKRVEDGVVAARAKGIQDSLVLVDNVALVVNVRSKTVITAIGKEQTNENVFTNIDGAVIV